MSANPPRRRADRASMVETDTVSRTDRYVMDQFKWEVDETLELVRSVTMAGSQIDGVTVDDIVNTCIGNLVELGKVLELDSFVTAVERLREVARFDRADGALVDQLIDAVTKEAST